MYGTLVENHGVGSSTPGSTERLRLTAETRFLGPATTRGCLLDLGHYPGLADGTSIVHGSACEVPDAATFAWLDAYEGITGTEADEYERVLRMVTLSAGTRLSAWLYRYRLPPAGKAVIASGPG